MRAVHRVIVGKAAGKKVKYQGRIIGENQTPTLTSSIQKVVFNPRWYLTDRIRKEIEGVAGADPAYLSKHGYVQVGSANSKSRLFQQPGPSNPLGRVKFEFPNGYAVFLHDTPKKQLFQRSRRDFSHGCVRVDKAMELAKMLLTDDENPAASKTEALLAGNKPQHIKLRTPIPIIIEYMPVAAMENGRVVFLGDVYGLFSHKSS